jgi:superfamily II DNA or RNA helicase
MTDSLEFRRKIQQEAVDALLSTNAGSIDLSMRSGKTKIGLEVASTFKRVLVSYPNKSIKDSWESDSEKFDISISHITFTTHVSLFKHTLRDYDCVILDEVDQVSLKGFEHLSIFPPLHLYGMSGTMPTKGEKAYFIKKLCPIVYVKTLDETTGITNKDYNIIVHLLQPSPTRNIPLSKGRFWSEAARIGYFDKKYKETRNFKVMIQLMQSIAYSDTKYQYALRLAKQMKRGLLFLEKIEQCEKSGFPTYHTQSKNAEQNLEDFQNQKINVLATVSQLKAGISFPVLNEAILLHSYSSNNRSSQKIGRCLQYAENEVATIHLIVLEGTRDEMWASEALKGFDQTKIEYVNRV